MREAPRWKRVAASIADRARADNLTLVAAGIAFFAFLSLFPALVALVSVYGLIADPTDVVGQVDRLSDALPGDARAIVSDQLQQVVASNRAGLSVGVLVGLAIALWGASTAVQQLLMALHAVAGRPENRGYAAMRLRAIGATAAAIIFVSVAIVLLTVGPSFGNDVAGTAGRSVVVWLRWPLLLAGFGCALGLLYRHTSVRVHPRPGLFSQGAVVATLAWSAASVVFSVYATTFGSYNKTYGSLAAVAILMLWLFLTAFCVLLGAEVNAVMRDETPTSPSCA